MGERWRSAEVVGGGPMCGKVSCFGVEVGRVFSVGLGVEFVVSCATRA